jgi:Domain of unknown function (DUF397)
MNPDHTTWRRSSYSTGGGNQCVEVAAFPDAIAIRDRKNLHGPMHLIHPSTFRDLTNRIKQGDHC